MHCLLRLNERQAGTFFQPRFKHKLFCQYTCNTDHSTAVYDQFWLSVQKLTFDPDRCFPIAVGILGRDLLLLQLMLVACADVMADGLANLVNKPGPVVVDGGCWISNDCVPSMLPSPARFGF